MATANFPDKRPRTESQPTLHSNTKKRHFEPDSATTSGTLCDMHEILESMSNLIVDDQDGGFSDLSSLTSLESEDEVEETPNNSNNQGLDDTTPSCPSGSWTGRREAHKGYQLGCEDLKGPKRGIEALEKIVENYKFDNEEANILRMCWRRVRESWPGEDLFPEELAKKKFGFINRVTFWATILQPAMSEFANHLNNTKSKQHKSVDKLLTKFKEDIQKNTVFSSPMLISALHSCQGHFKALREKNPQQVASALASALDESQKRAKAIKAAIETGKKARSQAVWIPVDNLQPNPHPHLGLPMVETQNLLNEGLKSGAIDSDRYLIINEQNGYRRICAPRPSNRKMHSIILWEPENSNDHIPKEDKAIGGVIHDAQFFSKYFGEQTDDLVKAQFQATYANLRSKMSIERNIGDMGLMVKDGGAHATYGVLNHPLPTVSKSSKKKMEEQKQLRFLVKKQQPFVQAWNFSLLLGFLPSFAMDQYNKAKETGLINSLGYPDTSGFATFAYSAGLHVDKDECATAGSVMKRGCHVKRHESNFVYGNHKVVVELNAGSHWFWHARRDTHGTTANMLAMRHPSSWKSALTLEHDRAVWTRATTIPKAVASAAHCV